MQTIVISRTYQLSGRPNATNAEDRTNYSHSFSPAARCRGLTRRDLGCDRGSGNFSRPGSLSWRAQADRLPAGTRAIALREPDMFYSRFLELYGRPDRLTLPERSQKANLLQALDMLAGQVYTEKLGTAGGTLQSMLHAGRNDSRDRTRIYLAAYTRYRPEQELKQFSNSFRRARIATRR